jgi:HsdM N-terminal domain
LLFTRTFGTIAPFIPSFPKLFAELHLSPKAKKKNSNAVQPKFESMSADIEKRLWQVADELRANSKLRSSEYSTPVLGLIFLRYASYKFG